MIKFRLELILLKVQDTVTRTVNYTISIAKERIFAQMNKCLSLKD